MAGRKAIGNAAQRSLFEVPAPPVVASFGGGVDSTAMLIEMVRRGERIDLILFADTGGEFPRVYEHVRRFSAWLVARGYPPVITVRAKDDLTLEQHSLNTGHVPSVAYRKTHKSCSQKFKVTPMNQYCQHWEPARLAWVHGLKVTKLIGYEANETKRVGAVESRPSAKYTYRYPLLEWGWDRARCQQVCRETLGYEVEKSACFFCPNTKRCELDRMAVTDPALLERAIHIEDNAQAKLHTIKGLGTSWRWRDYCERKGYLPAGGTHIILVKQEDAA